MEFNIHVGDGAASSQESDFIPEAPPLGIQLYGSPPNQENLMQDFNNANEATLRSGLLKQLSAASDRESFESMDIESFNAGNGATTTNASRGEHDDIPMTARGAALVDKGTDPCLGSAANQLPRQSVEDVSNYFQGACQSHSYCGSAEPVRSDRCYGEINCGYSVDTLMDCPQQIERQTNGTFNSPHTGSIGQTMLGPERCSGQPIVACQLAGIAGSEEPGLFRMQQDQQQLQQQTGQCMYNSDSVMNNSWTIEYQAPKVTQEPQVPTQHGFDSEGCVVSEGSVSYVPDSRQAFMDDARFWGAETYKIQIEMQAPIQEQTPSVPTPAPPNVPIDDDEEEKPLNDFALFESHSSSEPISQNCDLDHKTHRIREILSMCLGTRPDVLTKHQVLVHKVVHILLLCDLEGNSDLRDILSFCTEDGFESRKVSSNFMVRDTKVMGQVWKRLKGNTNGDYDTFARAMRTCRETKKDYFDYLDSGKGSRKRIYKLGSRSLNEIAEFSRNLLRI